MFRAIYGPCVALALLAGEARADRIGYTFTGVDSRTGNAVVGSLTYDSSAGSIWWSTPVGSFESLPGTISVTVGGQTYRSDFNTLLADIVPGAIYLLASHSNIDMFVTLAAPGSAPIFQGVQSVPANLNLSALGGSSFKLRPSTISIDPPGSPHNSPPDITSGGITSFDTVAAPEPGFLTLLAGALASAGLGRLRGRLPSVNRPPSRTSDGQEK
jgi:hypothetical protein